MSTKEELISVKQFRSSLPEYINKINAGQSFTVLKRSKAIFRVTPIDQSDDDWEEVIDFTRIKRGGVDIDDVLSRL